MSVFGSAAQGLQSGLDFALRADQARRGQAQTEFENTRQTAADERAAADLKIRQDREARAADTGAVGIKLKALTDRQSELAGLAAAAQNAGQPLNPAHSVEYDQNEQAAASLRKRLLGTDTITAAPAATATGKTGLSPAAQTANTQADPSVPPAAPDAPDLATTKQQGLDLVSKLTAGQIPLSSVKPADLYKAFTVTTGMKPEQLPILKEGADDVTAGIQTGNQGLVVQGANKLMSPRLMIGVGTASPHGGTITKKEIIGLDPMPPGPDGQSDPSKFVPRLRVYTDLTDDMGVPLFYDAPMSVGGGTDDAPMVIDIKKGMDNIGNMGVLAAAASHPDVADALAKGRAIAEPEMDKYLSGLQLAGMSKQTVGPDQQWINTVNRYMRANDIPRTAEGRKQAIDELREQGLHLGPGVGAATIREKIRLIDEMDISDDEKDRLKKALVDPTKPTTPLQQSLIDERRARIAGTLPMKGAPKGYASAPAGGGAGGTGSTTAVDPTLTGDDLLKALSPKDAASVKAVAEGKMKLNQVDNPKNSGRRERIAQLALQYDPKTNKVGGGAEIGARESVFINRVLLSANEANKDLENIVQMPLTASTGIFGGRTQGPGLFDATKEVLANKLTSEEVQEYNVMATGFQRSLAAIESAGLVPPGSLTHQMDAVLFKEGDTNLTKLRKLAQIRQIVEAGVETTVSNPRVPSETRTHAAEILASIKKSVPYVQGDLTRLKAMQVTNPNATLKDVMRSQGAVNTAPASAAPRAPAAKVAPPPGFVVMQ